VPYHAFISYSHAEDEKLAGAIQSALTRFARPWYRIRALRVFRDKTSLSANPALWTSIERGLDDSQFLVLLASPVSKASPWVTREIEAFLAARSADRILIVLTRGDIVWDASARDFDWARTTALPDCLRGRFAEQPLYVDMTWARGDDQLTLRFPRFRDAILDLAAPLHGKAKDELDGDDLREHRKTRRLATSAIVLLAALSISLGLAAVYATRQRNEALTQSRIANEQRRVADDQRAAAEAQRRVAETRRQEAEAQRRRAEDERAIALSRQLAAQAVGGMSSRLDLGLLQATQAVTVRPTREAQSALLATLFYSPHLRRFLWDEPATLSAATLSADGRVLVSLTDGGTLRLRSVTADALRPLGATPATRDVTAIMLSRDGRLLALASPGRVVVRDARTVAIVHTLEAGLEGRGAPSVLAFGHGKTLLAAYESQAGVLVWDVERRALRVPSLSPKRWEHALAFSPDDRVLASGAHDGTIVLWNTSTGRPLGAPLQGHSGKIFGLAFSPDGRVLASGSEDRTVRLWNAATGAALGAPLRGHEPWPLGHERWGLSLAFSPDGGVLASGAKDGNVMLWDVTGRERLAPALRGHPTGIVTLAFSADGRALVSVGQDGTVARWATDSARAVAATFEGLGDGAVDVGFSADGTRLTAASLEGKVSVWDIVARRPLRSPLAVRQASLAAVAFTPPGDTVLTATGRQLVEWDLSSGRSRARVLESGRDEISRIAFSPDRSRVATSTGVNLVVLDRPSGTSARFPLATASPSHQVTSLAFSPDGRLLASGAFDGTLALWDVSTARLARPAITAHREAVQALAFSPDGATLASAGVGTADFDSNVRMWETATGRPLSPSLAGHESPVRALVFSPDGQTLAAGEGDRVALWHVDRRQRMGRPMPGQRGPILALAFSPDGHWLASTGHDDRVLLWDLRTETWMARACATVNRRLSTAEWSRLVGDVPYEPACSEQRAAPVEAPRPGQSAR
jgi:WD40 repeat protein